MDCATEWRHPFHFITWTISSPWGPHVPSEFANLCSRLGVPQSRRTSLTLNTSRMEIRLPEEKSEVKCPGGCQKEMPRRGRFFLWLVCYSMLQRGRTFVGRSCQSQTVVFLYANCALIYFGGTFSYPAGMDLVFYAVATLARLTGARIWLGALFGCHWFQWSMGIMVKELAPLCCLWPSTFQCDNQNLVSSITKGIHLWFFVAFFDINITAEHIAGAINTCCQEII